MTRYYRKFVCTNKTKAINKARIGKKLGRTVQEHCSEKTETNYAEKTS